MTHTNLAINKLVCIDAYAENGMKVYKIAQKIKRSLQYVRLCVFPSRGKWSCVNFSNLLSLI
ncbi:hypothetical protein BWX42_02245 [Dolosigranulum pigrum]|uniref:Helix-turn-helix domain-containing protein n=1 Tax=Dolosigranulum pigrum TaxID=29394 RepID=A0A1S8KM38_9LACT|nr:hypothetical protein BWX42_02245 [Dolosigranulum pigrum]